MFGSKGGRMSPRPKSTAIAVVGAALAIAGCGGGGDSTLSNQEYAQKLNGVLLPLGQSLQQLGSEAQAAASKQELTSALDSADAAVKKASDGVEALDPPSAAAGTNDDLVAALNSYEGSISDTEQAIKTGTQQEIRSQVSSFQSDSQAFAAKLKQLKSDLISEGVKFPGGS
jgi:hypothetical protein